MSKTRRCRYCLDPLVVARSGGVSHDYRTAKETILVPKSFRGDRMPFTYTGRSSLWPDEPYCDVFIPGFTQYGLDGVSYFGVADVDADK